MRRGLAALSLLAAVVAVTLIPANPNTGAGAVEGDAPVVTAAPTTGLVDGQPVQVTIKAPAGVSIVKINANECRAGVTYTGTTGDVPPPVVGRNLGPNCPGNTPISSSGTGYQSDTGSFDERAHTDAGETFTYRVSTGTSAPWLDFATGGSPIPQRTITCDAANACVLLVQVQYQAGTGPLTWQPYPIALGFGADDPIAACGGAAKGALSTGGSDRMFDTWIRWTLAACRQPGAHGAPSRATFLGEGLSVDQVALGNLDLAYTAAGYDDDVALSDATLEPSKPDGGRRPVVAVPVAVNAAVVAVAGGVAQDPLHITPFDGVKMRATWLAEMLSGGDLGTLDSQHDILTENPMLPGLYDTTLNQVPVSAPADAETSSWLLTNYMKTIALTSWRVPDSAFFGASAGELRPASAALGTAQPNFFNDKTALLSGRPAFQKAVYSATSGSGGYWMFVDQRSAVALGAPRVAVENAAGQFVAPTPESLLAAVATMKEDGRGILIADPAAFVPGDGPQPYPLTMVEYALVPTQPLVNDDCSARTASQTLLHDWLAFITSDAGQAELPEGMVALPPELRAQAAERIAQVGATPLTGPCAEVATPPTSAPTTGGGNPSTDQPGTTNDFDGGGLASGASRSSGGGSRSGTTSVGPAATDSGSGQSATPSTQLVSAPDFGGRSGTDPAGAVLAVLGILGLSSVAAFATSKAR